MPESPDSGSVESAEHRAASAVSHRTGCLSSILNSKAMSLLGMGNPLLDISAVVPAETLTKYGVKPDDAVLAEGEQLKVYADLLENYADSVQVTLTPCDHNPHALARTAPRHLVLIRVWSGAAVHSGRSDAEQHPRGAVDGAEGRLYLVHRMHRKG